MAGFQIGVTVLNKMRRIPGQSVEVRAEKFAKHLHDSWGVGHVGCDDGAILLFSILDRQVYVSTGKQAMMRLTDQQIGIIIDEIKPYLQSKNYDKSVELAVVWMGEVFSGIVLEYPSHYYGRIIGTIIAIIVIVGIVLYLERKGNSRRTTMADYYDMYETTMRGSSSFTGAFEYYQQHMSSWSYPEFFRSSMPGGGSFGSDEGFGGGGRSGGGGGWGGSW